MNIEKELNIPAFDGLVSKTITNILYTSKWIEGKQMQLLKPFDLSIQQYKVLCILDRHDPEPLMLGQIQNQMLDKMSNASRLVEKLLRKNLIQRKVAKSDRRQVDITLTQEGRQLLAEVNKELSKLDGYFTKLGDEKLEELNKLLDRLRG